MLKSTSYSSIVHTIPFFLPAVEKYQVRITLTTTQQKRCKSMNIPPNLFHAIL